MSLIVGMTLCAHAVEPRAVTSIVPRVDLFELPRPVTAGLRIDLFAAPEKPVEAKAELLEVYVSSAEQCPPCRKGERERVVITGVKFLDIGKLAKPPAFPRNIWPVYVWSDRNGKWWHATGWESAKQFVAKVNNTPVAHLLSITE